MREESLFEQIRFVRKRTAAALEATTGHEGLHQGAISSLKRTQGLEEPF
ncbi:hypothetical protein [Halobacillus litoralis]|nr:hypothetical protein [Halobacillus litoralis]